MVPGQQLATNILQNYAARLAFSELLQKTMIQNLTATYEAAAKSLTKLDAYVLSVVFGPNHIVLHIKLLTNVIVLFLLSGLAAQTRYLRCLLCAGKVLVQ